MFNYTVLAASLREAGYDSTLNDSMYSYFQNYYGITRGQLNDLLYYHLGQLGYTGSLSDRMSQWDGTLFSPILLFTAGEQGAWFDPSDLTSMFQDSVGTTPVTAVTQPVGLLLDKRKGLVLGPELVTNGGFDTDTDWIKGAGVTISEGAAVFTNVGAGLDSLYETIFLSAPALFRITYTISEYTSGGVHLNNGVEGITRTSVGTFTETFFSYSVNLIFKATSAGTTLKIDNVSANLILGNHATQATAAARPTLSARVNLLTYSEQFDNAAWVGAGTKPTVTANDTLAPDGTMTADKLFFSVGGVGNRIQQPITAVALGSVISVWVKGAVGGENMRLWTGWDYVNFQTTTEWVRYSFVSTDPDPQHSVTFMLCSTSGTPTVWAWGAQAEKNPSVSRYQRIAAATDYDPVGFPHYLAFDGIDDKLLIADTDGLDFGQGSFIAAFALTSLGASDYDVIYGKGNSTSADNLRCFITANNNLQLFWGNDTQSYPTGATVSKNNPQIIEYGINSAIPSVVYAVNGAETSPAITLSGTGSNTLSATLGGDSSSYPANLNLYGCIIRKGTQPSTTEKASLRQYLASKAGVTL